MKGKDKMMGKQISKNEYFQGLEWSGEVSMKKQNPQEEQDLSRSINGGSKIVEDPEIEG